MSKLDISGLGEIIRRSRNDDFYVCPFCDDSKGHLGISRNKKIFHCFICNASGKIENLKPNLNEFSTLVRKRLNPHESLKSNKSIEIQLPKEYSKYIELSHLAYNYLRRREISDSEIKRYNIGYCSIGFFAHRIIIPIYEEYNLKYFVGRTYINANPRYMNSPTSKRGIIFKTFNGYTKEAIICEGIYDALRIGKIAPAIALLGKTADKEQLEKIQNSTSKVKIILDKDADKEGFVLYRQLIYFIYAQVIFINKKDPGEMTLKEIEKQICHH